MYTILKGNTAVCSCDNINTALLMVRSLESHLDRGTQHSPYTIIKTDDLVADANRGY